MLFGVIILAFFGIILMSVIFNLGAGNKEFRRVQQLIQNTEPVVAAEENSQTTVDNAKITTIEGFRTRIRQFKKTLAGVGKTGL